MNPANHPLLHADNSVLWVFAAMNLLVATGISVWVIRRQTGPGAKLLGIAVLIGGLLSPNLCPLWDYLTFVWHASPANTVIISYFGRIVTGWNYLAYYWFIGALGLFAYQRIKAGATVRDLWKLWAVVAISDIVLEVPLQLIDRNIYTYFGHQPFYSHSLFPLPLLCVFANAGCPLATAAVVLLLERLKVRGYLLAVPFFVAAGWFVIFYAMPAWPWWIGLRAGASLGVMYILGTITLVLVLFTYQLVATGVVRLAHDSQKPPSTPTPDDRPAQKVVPAY
jgi:hypothetical protein